MIERAVVTGIDRTTGTAQCLIVGGPTVTASYLNEVPAPRAIIRLLNVGGVYLVLGNEGGRRLLVLDDFMNVDVSIPLVNNQQGLGDTRWWAKVGVAGNGSTAGGTLGGTGDTQQIGVLALGTGGGAAGQYVAITKDPSGGLSVPSGGALWLSGRVAVSATTTTVYEVGFSDPTIALAFGVPAAGFRTVTLQYDSTLGANWRLRTGNGATETSTDTGIAVTASQWINFDLLYYPTGLWAALYIGGSLCAYNSTNVPGALVASPLNFRAYPRAASARVFYVDVLRLEHLFTLQPF